MDYTAKCKTENTRKIAASLTCHFCFRKQHCKNFLLTSMRVCPFLIIIYTGVSSGSNMSYEPEPEDMSGKRYQARGCRSVSSVSCAAFRQIVITSLSDMSRTAQCKKVKNDDGSSAYYGSIACAEL